jgi:Fic family protein
MDLPSDLAADVVDVERALATFGASTDHDLEQLARFLLRAEAVASSKIEGLEVSSRRLARHEARLTAGIPDRDQTADAVLGNIAAMRLAVESVASAQTVTVRHLLDIHAALMERSDRPDLAGRIRTTQNWIGGNDFNPCYAAYVPPPPDHVPALLEDLCSFANRDDLPGVVQAGAAHAQFETIHPFADGNGRTGRALIHVLLRRRELATAYVPPISLALATQAKRYVNGLNRFRYDGAPDGEAARDGLRDWLDVFLTATRRATADASELDRRLRDLEAGWRAKLRPRRDSAADRLLPQLIAYPVVTVDDVRGLTGASRAAAFNAIGSCAGAGVLREISGQQRYRLFEAGEVFDVLTGYERTLATGSGDTRDERPRRPVPYRS